MRKLVAVGMLCTLAACGGKDSTRPVSVARLDLTAPGTTLLVGSTMQLTATPKDANGNSLSGRAITFNSSSASVAAVNASGMVTGVAPGAVTITAMSENVSKAIELTVSDVPVNSVGVAPPTSNVFVGATQQLTATARDADGNVLTGRAVTWSSSSTTIATVSNSGLVTGAGPGTATITATSEGKSGTATVIVALVPVATVTVSPTELDLITGGSEQLSVTLKDANGNTLTGRTITYASSDANVATVSATGLVTGVTPGSATITVTSEGKSATATATVTLAPVHTITVDPSSITMTDAQTVQLTVTLRDINGNVLTGRTITFGSSNNAAATVSNTGLVTGVDPGTTTITVESEGKTATVDVTVIPGVFSVTVAPSTAQISVGYSAQLSVTLRDKNGNVLTGREIAFSSSNPAVATVDGNGLVTGTAIGTVTITATSEGKSGTMTANIVQPVATVTVQPETATLVVGAQIPLIVTLRDADGNILTGRVITFMSSNNGVATVNSSGVVTAMGSGSATITATSEGRSGTMTVTVP